MSRPSLYTEKLADEICEHIALGGNLNVLCGADGYPSQQTIYTWFEQHPEFLEKYERARARRADSRSDRIDLYKLQALHGQIPPDVARLVIDTEKWQAGKEQPKRYGDKTIHTGPDGEAPAVFTLSIDRRDKEL